MPRTTLDIDATVLSELKARTEREGTTMGRLASELLAKALHTSDDKTPRRLEWESQSMGALVDLDDKEAVRRALGD